MKTRVADGRGMVGASSAGCRGASNLVFDTIAISYFLRLPRNRTVEYLRQP